MSPPVAAPESPLQFAISQLTADVKPLVLKTMHGLISTALTSTLVGTEGTAEERQAEARAMAKFLRMIESNLGGIAFSSVSPTQQVRYVTPSQLPGAAAKPSTPRRKATPRGKSTP